MAVSFTDPAGVFVFIVFCSIYVCSILWIYGDATTRDAGYAGLILPFVFVVIGAIALIKEGWLPVLAVWPVGYAAWFFMRPKKAHTIVE